MTSDTAPSPASTTLVNRDDITKLLPVDGIGAELGVATGQFSRRLLEKSHLRFLYSIDMYAGDRGHDVEQYKQALRALAPYRYRNSILRMRFDEAVDLFENEYFDLVYVDGYAHTGEEEGRTIREWYPKVRRGGILAGDDYHERWPKVVEHVDAFARNHGLELHVIPCAEDTMHNYFPTWYVIRS